MLETKKDIKDQYLFDLCEKGSTVIRTSGSTGKATYICLNKEDIDNITSVGARCFINAGVKPGMKVINTLNSSMWAGGTLDTLSIIKAGAWGINFSVGNTKELIQVILDLKVEAISCTPSYLDKIEATLKSEFFKTPSQLGLKLILAGGEPGVQNPEFRKRIETIWDCKLIDANYGSADSVSIFASENSETQDGLKFLGYPECTANIMEDGGNISKPIEGIEGELLISTHWLKGLVNRQYYKTGDRIRITKVNDDNTFNFNIIGRIDDMIVIKGLNVYLSTVDKVIQKVFLEYGICGNWTLSVSSQDPIEECLITVDLMGNEYTDEVMSAFKESLIKELKVETSIQFEVEFDIIPLGTNGKTKRLLRVLA